MESNPFLPERKAGRKRFLGYVTNFYCNPKGSLLAFTRMLSFQKTLNLADSHRDLSWTWKRPSFTSLQSNSFFLVHLLQNKGWARRCMTTTRAHMWCKKTLDQNNGGRQFSTDAAWNVQSLAELKHKWERSGARLISAHIAQDSSGNRSLLCTLSREHLSGS